MLQCNRYLLFSVNLLSSSQYSLLRRIKSDTSIASETALNRLQGKKIYSEVKSLIMDKRL